MSRITRGYVNLGGQGDSAADGCSRPRSGESSDSYQASGGGLQDCPAAGALPRCSPPVSNTARAAGSRPPPAGRGQLAERRENPRPPQPPVGRCDGGHRGRPAQYGAGNRSAAAVQFSIGADLAPASFTPSPGGQVAAG